MAFRPGSGGDRSPKERFPPAERTGTGLRHIITNIEQTNSWKNFDYRRAATQGALGLEGAADAARSRRRGDRIAVRFAAIAHSRLWHETAVLCVPTNVCSWGKSGRAADIIAMTEFDPQPTQAAEICCDAQPCH
jgi:hypothetical protein